MNVRAILPVHSGLSNGSAVRLAFPVEHIHWFDATTGDRVSTTESQVMA